MRVMADAWDALASELPPLDSCALSVLDLDFDVGGGEGYVDLGSEGAVSEGGWRGLLSDSTVSTAGIAEGMADPVIGEAELSKRLDASISENAVLRKRVATLVAENRALRDGLVGANARLAAVAAVTNQQVPQRMPQQVQQQVQQQTQQTHQTPMLYGLAQVSADVAKHLAGAFTVSDASTDIDDSSGDDSVDHARRRKRRRVATGTATTMACFMFMFGFFFSTPTLVSQAQGPSERTDANLPAVWLADGSEAPVPAVKKASSPAAGAAGPDVWTPNCVRPLEQLPSNPDTADHSAHVHGPMFVSMDDGDASHAAVARIDRFDAKHPPQYEHVLCRDAESAADNVRSCSERLRRGEQCGLPYTLSLIMPAAAAGLEDDNDTDSRSAGPALAEVHCIVSTVTRIPSSAAAASSSAHAASGYGRIVTAVPQQRHHVANDPHMHRFSA